MPSEIESHFKNYNVETLSLSDMSFYRSDFISKFISMNKSDFHALSLTRVHFDEHIKDLADYLKSGDTKITKIVLHDCDIGDTNLTQMLADCSNLDKLKELHLVKMNMQEHMREIIKYLLDHKSLKILDLSNNELKNMNSVSEFLARNQVIKKLNIKGNPILHENDLRNLLFGLT